MDRTHSAQTIRLPAYAELLIDSMDRYVNGFPDSAQEVTSSSRWTTAIRNYALNGYFTRLAVTQIQFQWNLPTIIQAYNDTFWFNVDSGLDAGWHEINIPQSFYTPSELATAVEDALQAECPNSGLTCVYLPAESVFQIESSNSTDFYVGGPTAQGTDPVLYRRTLHTLGFVRTNTTPSTDYYGSTPTMLPTRYIDIISSYISKFQDVKDSSTSQSLNWQNKICRVFPCPPSNKIEILENSGPSDGPFYITIDYSTPKQIMWNPDEALNNFTIELRDEEGELVPFEDENTGTSALNAQYGCEYCITLYASET
jgi:hypothetical protein